MSTTLKGLAGLVLITCSISKGIFCTDSDLKMLSALPLLLRNYRSHGLSSFLAVPSINEFCGYSVSTSSTAVVILTQRSESNLKKWLNPWQILWS